MDSLLNEVMKEIIFTAEIVFFERAKNYFNFPTFGPLRTSLWLPDAVASTFSEIIATENQIQIWRVCNAQIKVIERDYLKDKIIPGQEFKLGVFPLEIAYGRIFKIM
jgi:hypothetical protein